MRLADELVAAALEVLGQAQQRGHPVQALLVALVRDRGERAERRHALAVVADRLADERDLALGVARQPGVEDEVARVLVVVVVVDGHPDVVEHRPRPEQLALGALARVQPGRGQLVVQLEGQAPDVRDVRVEVGVHAVLGGEVDDRRAADVVEQRLAAVAAAQEALEEHALAQTRLGDVDLLEAALLHDGLHDERAAEDDVGAVGLDPRDAAALGRRQVGELVHHVVERGAGEDEALHAELGDVGLALGRRGQVAHGAADPDHPRARAPQPRGALERPRDERPQLAQLLGLGRLVVGQEALRHAHRAERPGVELAREPALDVDELHRAAADVEHHAVGQRRRVHRREVAVAGLLLLGQHAHAQARALLGAVEELARVRGVADRAGGDRVDLVGLEPARPAEVGEDLHRRLRAGHAGLAELAGRGQALADADGLVDLVGALPPAVARGEHDEAERVRPEIDDSEPLLVPRGHGGEGYTARAGSGGPDGRRARSGRGARAGAGATGGSPAAWPCRLT